jgi:UDP-glucuronate 4-epimerase
VANPWLYIDANIAGTVNMLEFCRQNGVAKFVLASTSSVYGSGNELPYREGAVTDHPSSPYAATKKSAEVLCYVYHHLYGLDISVLRYFTVYGPAGRPDMSVFRFIQWIHEDIPVVIFGDGTQSRDFTYVDDIARGTIAALARVGFSIFNLGSDHPARVIDVLNVIERLAGKTANIVFHESHPADVRATWADISKAESILGWRPVTSHEQGLGQAVKWYQANREWAKGLCTGDG